MVGWYWVGWYAVGSGDIEGQGALSLHDKCTIPESKESIET